MPSEKTRANLQPAGEARRRRAVFSRQAGIAFEVLGLTPGSVTVFGLMNDAARRVAVVLDEDMFKSERVNFHPLHNAASTAIKSADLLKFVKALGYEPLIVDCGSG